MDKIQIKKDSRILFIGDSITDPKFNFRTPQEYFDNHFATAVTSRIRGALNGGDGIVKHLKSFGRNRFDNITVGGFKRLLCIKRDKEFDKKKFSDFVGEVAVSIFSGDMPYVEGTSGYNFIAEILDRFSFVFKKVEPKLSKDGEKFDLRSVLLNSIGNNKFFQITTPNSS